MKTMVIGAVIIGALAITLSVHYTNVEEQQAIADFKMDKELLCRNKYTAYIVSNKNYSIVNTKGYDLFKNNDAGYIVYPMDCE